MFEFILSRAPVNDFGGKFQSIYVAEMYANNVEASKQELEDVEAVKIWISAALRGFLAVHGQFISPHTELPGLAKFIVLTRSLSNSSHTHHQQPSLDRFEEVLAPASDHRRCSAVTIFVPVRCRAERSGRR